MKFCSLIFFLSLLIVIPNTGHAAEFAVTKTADTADGNCNDDCSLREAIIAANANGDADVITVPAGVYPLSMGTTGEDAAAEGDLDITEEVTINGAGVGATVIDGMKRDRVFEVDPGMAGITANINGLTIQNGSDLDDSDGGSGIVNWGILNLTNVHVVDNFGPSDGGGIYNQSGATLSLENVEVLRNIAVDGSSGGGIYNDGIANLNNSKVNDNISGSDGGGIYSAGGAGTELNISKSEVNDNLADGDGGGIYTSTETTMVSQTNVLRNTSLDGGGGLRLSGSTVHAFETTVIADNFAGDTGGGIYQQGSATLGSTYVDVGIARNFDASGDGGGVHLSVGSMAFNRAQIFDNETLGHGGGIYANGSDSIDLDLVNTTISQNIAGGSGGGIHHARGSLLTTNSTIVHNLADADDTGGEKGGGFFEDGTTAGSEFSNTILALNMDLSGVAPDCSGTITSDGGNLIQDTSDCTGAPDFSADITGEDPMIGGLAMNGGPTQTHHLLPGSMAIDNGVDANCPNIDQRGRARDDGDCDIGAVEHGVCGDGFIDGGEECDDGNNTDGDGCSSTCLVEAGFDCVGAPSVCAPVCGDGQVIAPEECDDGNTANGDGCSAQCTAEPEAAQDNGNGGGCNLNTSPTTGTSLGWLAFGLLLSLGLLRRTRLNR